ncbi:hypothetical protein ACU4GD_26340 [Cupriavidus basilensis]
MPRSAVMARIGALRLCSPPPGDAQAFEGHGELYRRQGAGEGVRGCALAEGIP